MGDTSTLAEVLAYVEQIQPPFGSNNPIEAAIHKKRERLIEKLKEIIGRDKPGDFYYKVTVVVNGQTEEHVAYQGVDEQSAIDMYAIAFGMGDRKFYKAPLIFTEQVM